MKYPSPSVPLIITGLTATGKTGLALELAREYDKVLISADSRQVYKKMDIGTGKYTLQQQISHHSDYLNLEGVLVYGLDLITPEQNFSASQYYDYVAQLTHKISPKQGIVVGGTGQYVGSLISCPSTYHVSPEPHLRQALAELESSLSPKTYAAFLQSYLIRDASDRYFAMNESDNQNPRRLQRALELKALTKKMENKSPVTSIPIIGLLASLDYLESKISLRVDEMYHNGLKDEVYKLVDQYGWNAQAFQTIGYQEWSNTHAPDWEILSLIKLHTRQYAKRQLTYLKKLSSIRWFDISDGGYLQAKEYCRTVLNTNTIAL